MTGTDIFFGTLFAAILAIVFAPRRSEMQQQNARDGHPEHHGCVSQRGVVEDCHAQPTRIMEDRNLA